MVVKKISANTQKGQALIEIILAIAIATVFLPSVVFTMIGVREAFSRTSRSLEANLLLQKEIEAIRSVKDSSWNSLTNGGPYYAQVSGTNSWVKANGIFTETNGLSRSFTVADVCRLTPTASPTAPPCSGLNKVDSSTKKVTATVSWTSFGSRSISTSFYISRFLGNKSWIQTTQADFNTVGNVKTNTVVTPTGEVEITPTASPNWRTHGSPIIRDFSGNCDATDVYVTGNRAYVTCTNETGSGSAGFELFIYDVTTPTNPIVIGGRDLGGTAYSIVVSGNYAYIATEVNNQELQVINISILPIPTLVGSYNSATNNNGRGVAIVGTTAYLVTDNNTTAVGAELYILNVSNPANPVLAAAASYRDLGASARDIAVSGSYAYIASTSNTQELQIINISNPSTLSTQSLVTYDFLSSTTDALTVFVVGTNIYLGMGNNLYLFTFTAPSTLSLPISYSAGGIVNGVFVLGNLAFIATSNSLQDFQVVNFCAPSTPILLGSSNLGNFALGVYVVGNYAYLATTDNPGEFKVIQGGPVYQTVGTITFESAPFNALSSVGFNSLNWVSAATGQNCTNTQFQVATSTNGSVWTGYSGPSGVGSFYTTPGPIFLDNIAYQYIKYKITFSGSGSNTPSVQEVSVNYSP